jgi:hypothetical protein
MCVTVSNNANPPIPQDHSELAVLYLLFAFTLTYRFMCVDTNLVSHNVVFVHCTVGTQYTKGIDSFTRAIHYHYSHTIPAQFDKDLPTRVGI